VEDVIVDSKMHKVVVKGKKVAANPAKMIKHVQKKTGRKVELLSPISPPLEEKKEEERKEEPKPLKPEEKGEVSEITVVLTSWTLIHPECHLLLHILVFYNNFLMSHVFKMFPFY
jgi:hypothetical protein